MGESICLFCKTEDVKCVKHRSTVLNFDCSLDAKTNLQIPEDLGPWMFFKALFPCKPYYHFTVLTDRLRTEWKIGEVLPETTEIALVLMWSQTAGFHLSVCISTWQLCVSLSLSQHCLISLPNSRISMWLPIVQAYLNYHPTFLSCHSKFASRT